MAKISEAQMFALKWIVSMGGSAITTNYSVGEALRRKGLVERDTTHIIRRVYATKHGETELFRHPARNPHIQHEWHITPAGRALLDKE